MTSSEHRISDAEEKDAWITAASCILLLLLLFSTRGGAVSGPDSIQEGGSERANLSNAGATVDAQAGNVTALNIDATAITEAWQGYYGNITGSITLEDASGDVFYNWSSFNSLTGEVYASRNESITWDGINCTNSSEVQDENSYLGKSGAESDSVNQTFDDTTHPSFLVGTTRIEQDTCYSTNTFSGGSQNSDRFHEVLLSDNASKLVYTTIIDEDQVGFDNGQYDFQMLVGENGNETQESSTTTYNFYIELT